MPNQAEHGERSRDEELLIAIRRITRAIDLHSRALLGRFQLTSPQLLVLRTVKQRGETTAGDLARAISLSQPTLTGILDRLESKGLVRRRRSKEDRRKVIVQTTAAADTVLSNAPRPLQEAFLRRYEALPEWEQTQILSSLQRVVAMMDAEAIDASPMLAAGSLQDSESESNGDA